MRAGWRNTSSLTGAPYRCTVSCASRRRSIRGPYGPCSLRSLAALVRSREPPQHASAQQERRSRQQQAGGGEPLEVLGVLEEALLGHLGALQPVDVAVH